MRETVNTVKIPTPRKFSLVPKNEEETKYLERLENLLSEKRRGDWGMVSEIVNIPVSSAEKAFYRVYSKNHFEVVNALSDVIKKRKELLNPES
ncbi:hypothetical protein LJF28_05000 [Chryseobacterium indologenes]|uniref:hypothetical protein n=1 Tax=Chryseobacterium indologenes TaxID=253 RepID=UPI001D0D1470|nr:hypothetical protein [Chryseobacterium indologenes]UDQ55028.1 hypothetical protein LJF28_05000 [Chryseobacterium indologenes]